MESCAYSTVKDGYLYAVAENEKIMAHEIVNPNNITFEGEASLPVTVNKYDQGNLLHSGNWAYLIKAGSQSITTINLQDGDSPAVRGSLSDSDLTAASGATTANNKIYVGAEDIFSVWG